MSYSTCFLCGKMVSMYEKYCSHCLEKYSLAQGDWRAFKPKTEYGTPERELEKEKEKKKDYRSAFFLSPRDSYQSRKTQEDWDRVHKFTKRACSPHKFGRKVRRRKHK